MHESVSVHSNILGILYITPNCLPPSFFEPSLSKLHLKEDGRWTTRAEIFARHPIIGGVKDERGGSRSVRRRARSERRATGIVAAPFPRKIPRAGWRASGGGRGHNS